MGEGAQEDGWVVCRIFKKRNHQKTLDSHISSSLTAKARNRMFRAFNDGALEQILEYMERNCEDDCEPNNCTSRRFLSPMEISTSNVYPADSFMELPSLESPNSASSQNCYQPMLTDNECSITNQVSGDPNSIGNNDSGFTKWAVLDRLVASQLNGQTETCRQLACFDEHTTAYCSPSITDHHDLQLPALRPGL